MNQESAHTSKFRFFVDEDVCSVFSQHGIGTYVPDREAFEVALTEALQTYEFPELGQGVILLDDMSLAKCGVIHKDDLGEDQYEIARHRGRSFLGARVSIEGMVTPKVIKAIVYTRQAWTNDPQTDETRLPDDADFVIVAVIADLNTDPVVGAGRFVANLAGGNNAYKTMSKDDLVELAKKIEAQKDWITVVR